MTPGGFCIGHARQRAVRKSGAGREARDGAVHIGPAHAKMHSLAIDRQKRTGIPYRNAYSEVYVHGANAACAQRSSASISNINEVLTHGRGGVTHTLSTSEAENLDGKVPSFRGTGYDRAIAEKKLQELSCHSAGRRIGGTEKAAASLLEGFARSCQRPTSKGGAGVA